MKLPFLRRTLAACLVLVAASASAADLRPLPQRGGPLPVTTNGVPHIQIGIAPVPEISAELLRRVSTIPGVEIGETVVSLPGARGFRIVEGLSLARPDVIVGGREFAHMHPDGSLHASLSPERAREAVAAGWATPHPWASRRPGWEGFVMIYTPVSGEELDVVFRLVEESFGFVTGRAM